MVIVPLGSPQGGLGRVILGPFVPRMSTLAVLITLLVDSCVIGKYEAPRPNLKVYLGFSVCPLAFLFPLVWYYFSTYSQISFVILKFFTGVK